MRYIITKQWAGRNQLAHIFLERQLFQDWLGRVISIKLGDIKVLIAFTLAKQPK